jgi:hypothetical protein
VRFYGAFCWADRAGHRTIDENARQPFRGVFVLQPRVLKFRVLVRMPEDLIERGVIEAVEEKTQQ